MAGERVNTYAQDDSDILALQLTTDKTFKGYHQLTLTEYDTTTVPAIAAGSAIECNGALYKFDTEEAISTTDPVTSATVADGTVYVCIIPDTTTATAAFTATAPTWSDSKQGWYGTGDQANYRYAEYLITKAAASYGKGFWNKLKTIIRAGRTNTQDITSSGYSKLLFNSEIYDTKAELATSTITVKNSGYYHLFGVIFLGTINTDDFELYLYKNGSSDFLLQHIGGDSLQTKLVYNTIIFLNAGDYIELYIRSISDTDFDNSTLSTVNLIQLS